PLRGGSKTSNKPNTELSASAAPDRDTGARSRGSATTARRQSGRHAHREQSRVRPHSAQTAPQSDQRGMPDQSGPPYQQSMRRQTHRRPAGSDRTAWAPPVRRERDPPLAASDAAPFRLPSGDHTPP